MAVVYLAYDRREHVMESPSQIARILHNIKEIERWPFIRLTPVTDSSEPTVIAVAHITHITP